MLNLVAKHTPTGRTVIVQNSMRVSKTGVEYYISESAVGTPLQGGSVEGWVSARDVEIMY